MQYFIKILIIISLLFCCQSSWLAIFLSPMESVNDCHQQSTQNDVDLMAINHVAVIMKSAIVFLVLLSCLYLITFGNLDNGKKYRFNFVCWIRDRYGGWQILNKWLELLRFGLLSPKII